MVYGTIASVAGNYVAKRTYDEMHKRIWRAKGNDERDTNAGPSVGGYGGGHTKSVFRAKKHSKKHDKRMERFRSKITNAFLQHCKFGYLDTFRVSSQGSSASNQQCWLEIPILMGNQYDLTDASLNVIADADNKNYWTTKFDAGDWPTLVDCFENGVTTLTGVPNTTPALGPNSTINTEASGHIYGYNIAVTMQNLCSIPIKVTIYELVCVKTFTNIPSGNTDPTAGICKKVYDFLINTNAPSWNQSSGFTTAGPNATVTSLGFSPMSVPFFGTYWKCLNAVEHVLDPKPTAGSATSVGQVMSFEKKFPHKGRIHLEQLRGNVCVAGLSRCYLIKEAPLGIDPSKAGPLGTIMPAFGESSGIATASKIHGVTYTYTKRFMMKPEPISTLMARPRQQENA
jgi:hypothetical protein